MKPILLRDALKEIRATLGRFVAIFAIVALGVGIFAGLRATTPDMINTADMYFRENNLMDLRLVSTMGFTEEDVTLLREQPGIQDVMPTYTTDALFTQQDGTVAVRVHTLDTDMPWDAPDNMNRPVLVQGRLPQKSGECVVDAGAVGPGTAGMGDVIRISGENEQDTQDMFRVREFTVVGMVESPYYISFQRGNTSIGNGRIAYYVIVPQQDISSDVYLELFATLTDTQGLGTYSDEYTDLVDSQIDGMEAFRLERERHRYHEVQDEANEKIEDARQELADGEQELADAKVELQNGRAELADGRQKLTDAKAEAEEELAKARQELTDGEDEIAAARREIRTSEQKLADGEKAYTKSRREYDDKMTAGQAEIDAGRAALEPQVQAYNAGKAELDGQWAAYEALGQRVQELLDAGQVEQAEALRAQMEAMRPGLDAAQAELDAAWQQIVQAQAELDAAQRELDTAGAAGWQQLMAARTELDSGRKQLSAGRAELADAEQTLKDGRREYAGAEADADAEIADAEAELKDAETKLRDAEAELTDAETKLRDGQAELKDAEEELAELEPTEWYILDRSTNMGYAGYKADADKIAALSSVFPVFFFLVAALVCLTTMTRMVEEQRTQIGVLKALGYGKAAIAGKYILYALVASVSGSVAGLLLGFWMFPTAITNAYGILYRLPPVTILFHMDLAVLGTVAATASTVLAALWACMGELQTVPAELIRPKSPTPGKRVFLERITPIWRRINFIQKVTVRNMFRYKKRFFMTVIGIGGCTMLMLTGFGLRDSITNIVGRQYTDIQRYDASVSIDNTSGAGADTPLNAVLADMDGEYVYVDQPSVTALNNGQSIDAYAVVPEDAQKMSGFVEFRERESQKAVAFPQPGKVVVTEKLAKTLDVQAGDTITLKRGDIEYATVMVGGVVENYIYNYVYMTAEDYAQAYGEQPAFREILFRAHEHPFGEEQEEAFSTELLATDNVEAVAFTTKITRDFQDVMGSLDSVVVLLIACANLLAFIVLYNLANINITERTREIATIRVLGFYEKETVAYVYRENLALTAIGTLVGLVGGVFLHQYVVVTAEVDMVMFERVIQPLSYVFSVLLTFGFALAVNFFMRFRINKISMVESLKSAE